MDIELQKTADVAVITLNCARLDAANSGEFKQVITEAIESGSNKMVVDLKNITFIDSSGLGSLVTALKRASAVSGNVVVSGLNPSVRKLFELTRLHRVFDITGSVEEGIAMF